MKCRPVSEVLLIQNPLVGNRNPSTQFQNTVYRLMQKKRLQTKNLTNNKNIQF